MTNGKSDLIVVIVKRGQSMVIVDAAKAAGAEGATIIPGRGTGIHEQKKLFGLAIEPEKDVVLSIVPQGISERVLEAVISAGDLRKPATGIAFVIELSRVAGIAHLLN